MTFDGKDMADNLKMPVSKFICFALGKSPLFSFPSNYFLGVVSLEKLGRKNIWLEVDLKVVIC